MMKTTWKHSPVSSTQGTPGCLGFCCFRGMFRGSYGKQQDDRDIQHRLDELQAKVDRLVSGLTQAQMTQPDKSTSQRASQALQLASNELRGIEVARYSQLPQFDASILDTYIPQCRRLTQLHFGHIVSNPHAPMAFSEKVGYNMTYNLVPPGNGNALHMHKSIEIFVALDGKWEIAWGMKGEHTVVLQPWDFVVVPARVCHSYKNIEEQTAQNIMTILPGKSWIAWAPDVVDAARSHGAECDDNGQLLKYAHLINKAEKDKGLGSSAANVEWKHMGPDEMAPFVYRYAEKKPFQLKMEGEVDEDGVDGKKPYIELFWKTIDAGDVFRLPRKDGVDLLVTVLDGTVIVKNERGATLEVGSRLDSVRIPVKALAAGEVMLSNPCPTACHLLVTATEMRMQNDMYFHLC